MAYTKKAGCAEDEIVVRDRDGEFLWPNKDGWDEYLAWLKNGNKPKSSIPPPAPVPLSVPLWAARTILQQNDLLAAATQAVNASDNMALKNVWEYGNYIDRKSPAIQLIASALGLTSVDVDQMFIDANALIV